MNLALTDDQLLIRDAAISFLTDHSDSAAIRRAMTLPQGYDPEVWQTISQELGWTALLVPERFGGMGLGTVELSLIMEQLGRHLTCAPFFSTVCLAANLIEQVGSEAAQAHWLSQIAAGVAQLTAELPLTVDGWSATGAQATAQDTRWLLDGVLERVPNATTSAALVVVARVDQGLGLFLVPTQAQGVELQPLTVWDSTRPLSQVQLCAANAERIDDPARMNAGLPQALARARLALAAEQLGCAQACLDLTVTYTQGRKQFGRVIAGFQAVKHRCAEMMVRIEALRSAIMGTAVLLTSSVDANTALLESAVIKALASDTAFYCAQEAIQLHGGVGFTWEYDPQLYFKRAQVSSHALGTADALREFIAAEVLA